ncbi:cytochrome P450 [Gymnopilus junonius]|uniref:Cytochrome P450 n=1 Tax=Gymnopilus junonius TaxID=109634 RepID=A0A9P5NJE8_GYMJU|nr:cytochrome P450 [Gymnopilus junonius]
MTLIPSTNALGLLAQHGIKNGLPLFFSFLCALISVILYVTKSTSRRVGKYSLPPGLPRRFFGLTKTNFGMPTWKALALLHEKYGPVTSIYQGNKLIISLGTIKAATDLLEKRSGIYSSRPRNIMGSELMSGGMRGVNMPYGPRWRNWRSLMHTGMGIQASGGHKCIQSLESKIMLHELLESNPATYGTRIRRTLASISMSMAYGSVVSEHGHQPGKYVVESRFMQWFRRVPEAQRKSDTQVYMALLNEAREKVVHENAPTSILKKGLERQADYGMSDVEMAFALSAPFSAGVATSSTSLEVFILAMLYHPHVMRKAQDEIDKVIGQCRLPEFEDADFLPYINAVIKETLRWRPLFPMGIPHDTLADDVYEDMHIPMGSSVVWNAYLMSRDEKLFSSAEEFKPERYLDSKEQTISSKAVDPAFVFGLEDVFVLVCTLHGILSLLPFPGELLLWAFDILPSKDNTGNEILPSVAMEDFVEGLAIRPHPFGYLLKPRKGDEEAKRAKEEIASTC